MTFCSALRAYRFYRTMRIAYDFPPAAMPRLSFSLLIYSRMDGEQVTSRTPSVSHRFRNRITSTCTSVTSSSCRTAPGTAAFQLPCHFRNILRSNSTDQPDGRAAPVRNLFYLQGHVVQIGMMLIFRQMPNCQQAPTKSEQPNLVLVGF